MKEVGSALRWLLMNPNKAKLRRKDNMILYTDTVQGKQTCRDDLWAISSEELAAHQSALLNSIRWPEKMEPIVKNGVYLPTSTRNLLIEGYNDGIDQCRAAVTEALKGGEK